jgi:hypothetical protein
MNSLWPLQVIAHLVEEMASFDFSGTSGSSDAASLDSLAGDPGTVERKYLSPSKWRKTVAPARHRKPFLKRLS